MNGRVLEEVIRFADRAQGEQKRKYSNERYIVHPVRVMQTRREYTNDLRILCAAILHDVLEDTETSEKDIHVFLTTHFQQGDVDAIVRLVVELTDVYTKKDFPRLNRRRRKQMEFERLSGTRQEAQTIKYADLLDNSLHIAGHDPDFARIFLQEARALLAVITRGDQHLLDRVRRTVHDCIQTLDRNPLAQKNL